MNSNEHARHPTPPEKRRPRDAVGWLLGPELIGQLSKIARKRSDPRDWMSVHSGVVHDEHAGQEGELVAPGGALVDGEVVWFDYLADGGDGSDAMYALAYACQGDLQLELGAGEELPTAWTVDPHHIRASMNGNLPRGQFLFFGGDTAYHVADKATIHNRVAVPFAWATEDLVSRGHLSTDVPPRRLYGIPGNHDWYDNLRGFSRVFRKDHGDPIDLPGLKRMQAGSYVAIQLPHGWQLWGLDIDGDLDDNQKLYFESLCKDMPRKLILCTPSPAVVFGEVRPKPPHAAAMKALGLPAAYADKGALPAGHLRLDLSGDVHHYARYRWKGDSVESARYMSVVSGLGGAFHHPSFTRTGDLQPVMEYPTPNDSREAIGPMLLRMRSVLKGSWIRTFPICFAVLLGFAATRRGGTSWLLARALSLLPGAPTLAYGELAELGRAALMLVVIVAAIGLARYARRRFELTREAQDKAPWIKLNIAEALSHGRAIFDPKRSYWLPTLVGGGTLLGFALFMYSPLAPSARTGALDVATLLVLMLGCLGGIVAIWNFARKKRSSGLRQIGLTMLGLSVGLSQVVTPLFAAMAFTANWVLAIPTAIALVFITWRILLLSQWLFDRGRSLELALVALMTWIAGLVSLVWLVWGHILSPRDSLIDLVLFFAAGLLSMCLGTMYLAWYFAVAGLCDGHNNEVGGAARVTCFREFIRFRLSANRLTGYVIAVEDGNGSVSPAREAGTKIRMRLVDVFTIADK